MAKYIKREEYWFIKFRDWWIKDSLMLKMLEWNKQVKHHWAYDTKYAGKGIKNWLDEKHWKILSNTFVGTGIEENWNVLLSMMCLFREVASETAQLLNFTHHQETGENMTQFIKDLRHRTID
jgi:aminoglycoside 6-adenylyltransferase